MELESYRRSWDSFDQRNAFERLVEFIDAKMEILLALAVFAVAGFLVYSALT